MKNKFVAAVVVLSLALGVHTIAAPQKVEAASVQYSTGKVVAYVTMRTGASTSYRAIRTLKPGETFQILDKVRAGYWYKINVGGTIGYVSTSSKYVKIVSQATPAPTPVPTPTPSPNPGTSDAKIDTVIAMGMSYIGKPYVFGAGRSNDNAFDCSGFVSWIFNHNGIALTKSGSVSQAKAGTYVPRDQLRKGDLVFSDTNHDGKINHVSLYIGDGKLLHTYKVGVGVTISNFAGSAWDRGYVTARRIVQ